MKKSMAIRGESGELLEKRGKLAKSRRGLALFRISTVQKSIFLP